MNKFENNKYSLFNKSEKVLASIVFISLVSCFYKISNIIDSNKYSDIFSSPVKNISTSIDFNAEKIETEDLSILKKINIPIEPNSNLSSALKNAGIENNQVYALTQEMAKIFDLTKIKPEHKLTMIVQKFQENQELKKIELTPEAGINYTVNVDNGKYSSSANITPFVIDNIVEEAVIYNSFNATAKNLNIPTSIIYQFADAFSGVVDFKRDIKLGDSFKVLYEVEKNPVNNKIKNKGKLLYASITLRNKEFEVFRYQDAKGNFGFYDSKGNSLRTASFLTKPLPHGRISSPYGIRKHPILGYRIKHYGVDYAAPIGTPIYAASDGIIQKAAKNGNYGNYVRIKHNGVYSTAYGHISRFAKGIKSGVNVKKGQVIAYVGNTGRSTGPHLHFELIKNNIRINPTTKAVSAVKQLAAADMVKFSKVKTELVEKYKQIAYENSQKDENNIVADLDLSAIPKTKSN